MYIMAKFEYPHTPEVNAARSMLGGPPQNLPSHVGEQFSKLDSLWGSKDANRISNNDSVAAPIPYPTASRTKKDPLYDRAAVREALTAPRSARVVEPTDPRRLHASQPGVTRSGVKYYMGDTYAETGETYADKNNAGNQIPVVYNKSSGQRVILSGHHRATAALLKGEQFDALQVHGD